MGNAFHLSSCIYRFNLINFFNISSSFFRLAQLIAPCSDILIVFFASVFFSNVSVKNVFFKRNVMFFVCYPFWERVFFFVISPFLQHRHFEVNLFSILP